MVDILQPDRHHAQPCKRVLERECLDVVCQRQVRDHLGGVVTADRYTHALVDYREIDRTGLLGRVRLAHLPMHTRGCKNGVFAGM